MSGNPLSPEEVAVLLRAATRAPSIHNTQPWRFSVVDDTVHVWADDRRHLVVADPQRRELLISCGAATFGLRLAMAQLGYEPRTAIDVRDDHVASVTRGAARRPDAMERRLYDALPYRRTHRRPFAPGLLTKAACLRLDGAAHAEGAWLRVVDSADRRRRVAELMWEAARRDISDLDYARELRSWMRYDRASDGVPLANRGQAPYPVDGLPGINTALDDRPADAVAEEVAATSVLVLGTGRDGPDDRVRAGVALQRVLLEATAQGIVTSFANQVAEHPDLRDALADAIGAPGWPQLLIRAGRPLVDVPETPRRNLHDVFRDP